MKLGLYLFVDLDTKTNRYGGAYQLGSAAFQPVSRILSLPSATIYLH